MNNISFQGHTYLNFKQNTYDDIISKSTKKFRNLSYSNKSKLTNGKLYTTKADAENIAVIVRNEKEGYIKYVPVNGKIQQVIDDIAQKIDELKAMSKNNLTAWIIGGETYTKPNGENTIKTVNEIADIVCDRPDIDASILAGSKKGEDRIVIHTLNNQLNLTLDKPIERNNTQNKNELKQELEKYFDIVELNNTDII